MPEDPDLTKTYPKRPFRVFLKRLQALIREPRQFNNKYPDQYCPICEYRGRFLALGTPSRWHGRCPNCGCRERHRLIHLFMQRHNIDLNDGRHILHFAPESYFVTMMQANKNYHSADIVAGKAQHTMDMSNISFDDGSIDMILTNHVLEHVADDQKALREFYRVLKPGGIALITVPINWARLETYENPRVLSAGERFVHYGDVSHLRFYGRDFEQRLKQPGFMVECWRLPQDEEPLYGLLRDDVLWVATKPDP